MKKVLYEKQGNFIFQSNVKDWKIMEGNNYIYYRTSDKYSEKRSLKIVILKKFNIQNPEKITFSYFQFGIETEIRNSKLYNLSNYEIDVPFLYLYPEELEPKEKLVLIQGLGKDCAFSSGHTNVEVKDSLWSYNWKSFSNTGNHWQEYKLFLLSVNNKLKAEYIHGRVKSVKEILFES